MAVSEINCFKTVNQFKFNVDNLNSAEFTSPEVILSQVHWKIKLSKRTTGETNVLDVALVASLSNDETIAEWSCEARAVFKLISFDSENNVVKQITKQEFTKDCTSHQIREFIRWNELTDANNRYFREKDNEATFEVEISTNPLKCQKPMAMETTSADLHVFIKNVSKLGYSLSPEVIVRGIRWTIKTKKEAEHLAVYLWADQSDMDMNWSWEVESSCKLLSFKDNVEPIVRKATDVFRWGVPNWGFPKFIKWSEFCDANKRYVYGETAIIEFRFVVKAPKPLFEFEKQLLNVSSPQGCVICLEKFHERKISSTKCGHMFCSECIRLSVAVHGKCPVCNAVASIADLRPLFFSW